MFWARAQSLLVGNGDGVTCLRESRERESRDGISGNVTIGTVCIVQYRILLKTRSLDNAIREF